MTRYRIPTIAGIVMILAVALAACGGDDEPESAAKDSPPAKAPKKSTPAPSDKSASNPDKASAPKPDKAGGWTGLKANTYEVARDVCSAFPLRKAARDLGLPASSDEFTVAEEYAAGSTNEHQQPAFEGCLEGLGVGG